MSCVCECWVGVVDILPMLLGMEIPRLGNEGYYPSSVTLRNQDIRKKDKKKAPPFQRVPFCCTSPLGINH
jgi:hypothetical protein